jgi:hypothetical protein
MKLDTKESLEQLKQAGFVIEDAEETLIETANKYNTSPKELFLILQDTRLQKEE